MSRPKPLHRAFSLIEVVLALGVVSFAIVAILGILPLALSSNRSGMNEARAAQLVRAITGTIDSQCSTFSTVNCYGQTLDLTSSTKGPITLYASYSSPGQPTISTSSTGAIYSIELRFDNDPSLSPSGITLGAGKVNLIEIRIYGKSQSEGGMEFFYLARNKG
jgi:uncharacterized protein (TIGR02598 family)